MKITGLCIGFVLITLLGACKKEFSCSCTSQSDADYYGYSIPGYTPPPKNSNHTGKVKKKKAEEWCEGYESNNSTTVEVYEGVWVNINETTECKLD